MKLVIITALIAVCSSAKLDRSYLPPPSASSAGGSHDSLQTPLTRSSSQESGQSAPIGSYTNNFQGVVVDAAAPGTRASADQLSGLGGSRPSYGSTDSKVGEAAFRGSAGFRGNAPNNANAGFRGNAPNNANAGFRGNAQTNANGVGFDNRPERTQSFNGQSNFNGQTFSSESKPQTFANNGFPEATPERPQAYSDRNSNILAYSNDVDTDKYSYGFETDNGIAIGENGVAINGIVAQGGYSYKGDDGQVYKVTYVADEKGYRPVGDHLPTPPPIPQEILKSLEQNAKDEAAGLIDDGSYDAQKYNAEGDYTHHNGGDNSHNGAQLSQFGNRPESDAITSGTIINHNSQAFGKPASTQNIASGQFNGNQFGFQQQSAQVNQGNGNSNGFQSSQSSQQTGNQFGSAAAPTRPNFAGVPNRFQASQSNQQTGLQSGTASNQDSSINRFQNTQTNQQAAFGNSGSQQFGQQSANNFGSASAPTGQTNGYQNTQFSQQAQFNNNNQRPSQFGFQSNSQSLSNKPSVGQNTIGQNLNGNAQSSQSYNGQAASSPNGFQQQTVNRFQSQYVQSQSNIQNQPSVGSFNAQQQQQSFGQQPNRFGSSGSISRFTQSDRFGGNNEYLPPTSDNKNTASSVSSQAADNGDSFPDFVALNKQTQQSPQNFASASASVGPQPSSIRRPVNTFPENQNINNQAAPSPSNSGIREQFGDVSKPTAIPDTELTTPFESNDKSPLNASPISQTSAIVGNFGAPSSNNFQQSEPNTQSTDEQPSSQTLSPVMPTSQPQPSNGFPNKPTLSGNTQFSQTTYMSQENQQPSAYQGVDHSYFYNQPSKPFNTAFGRPQASRFPSTTSYQTNGFGSQNNQFVQQNSGSSNVQSPSTFGSIAPTAPTQFGQSQGFSANQNSGITQAAISSFPAVSPTSSNQFGAASNQFGLKPGFVQQSSSFNQQQSNIGSASFPSQSAQPGFPSQPVVPFNQATTPSPTDSQPSTTAPDVDSQTTQPDGNEPIVQNQQYDGTLYEYNKPPETLPASSDSDSSQTVQSIASQDNQAANAEGSKPQGIMETTETEQPSRNQASIPTSASATSFGNQAPNQFNQQQLIGSIQYSQASQSQGSFGQSQQNNQVPQSNTPFKPSTSSFGSNFQGYPTAAASKPQVGFPIPQNSQAFGSQGVQPSRGPSSIQGQGPIAPTTNTGFPQSSKPQFGQNAQNNFGQNTAQYQGSQPSQQSFGLSSQFNQQNVATANSAAFNPSPFGQASAQASVSQNEPEVNPTFQPQTSFNQSPQSQIQNNQSQNPTAIQNGVTAEKKPIFNSACCRNTNGSAKPVQPNRGSTFTGFQGNNVQSLAGVGENFSGPRQPPSFDDQTGYHY